MRAVWPLCLVACGPKLPSALRLDDDRVVAATVVEVTDEEATLRGMLRGDPLARRPLLPEAGALAATSWGGPLVDYVQAVLAVESGAGEPVARMRRVEESAPGSVVVALGRGVRLQMAETLLARPTLDARAVTLALTDLGEAGTGAPTDPLRALRWVGEGGNAAEEAHRLGEQHVLAGWLVSPSVPLSPVADALKGPLYDGLSDTPLARLITSRAAGLAGDCAPGLADLRRATALALEQAAADRDKEQAAWAATRTGDRELLGVTTGDPVKLRLDRAIEALIPVAGDRTGAGGALLAIAARRWDAVCGTSECAGLDRVQTMADAARWGVDLAPLVAVWQGVALKEAIDSMEVGHDTVLFERAVVGLVDALQGTGSARMPVDLVERTVPDAATWHAIGSALGQDGTADWASARVAVGRHLADQATKAAALQTDPVLKERLDRIRLRAVP